MEPLIAPPGVAYVEHTSTGPTRSVTLVGGVSGGTDTHPVRRLSEKCSTIPTGAGADPGPGDGSPRRTLAALPNLLTSVTLIHLPAGAGRSSTTSGHSIPSRSHPTVGTRQVAGRGVVARLLPCP